MCDPIPAPKEWETYEIYRKSLIRPIKNALRDCTFLSMNTQEMIKFQQTSVKFDLLNKSFVSPDPVNSPMRYFGKLNDKNVLLFLGTFYSARKPDKLVLGFSRFIQEGNEAELHIIGHSHFDLKKFNLPDDISKRIIFNSWKEDISEEYRRSRVLVDVDADIANDVFISSKLKSYLSIDRVILSITRKSSPSYKLLSEVGNSSVISDFDEEAICSAIKRSLSINYTTDLFNDRKNLLQVLSAKEVVGKMAKQIGATIRS
jgi:glycosyltransferase involved in cell wall biosynthesis